jgi:hypothetical protein
MKYANKQEKPLASFTGRLTVPLNIRRTLYLALARPILEYSSIIWHPLNTTLTNSNRLESTLRFASRVILQSWNLSHDKLLSDADLPTLAKRREIAALCHNVKDSKQFSVHLQIR